MIKNVYLSSYKVLGILVRF